MKKLLACICISFCVLNAFANISLGIKGGVMPAFATGGDTIAQSDLNILIKEQYVDQVTACPEMTLIRFGAYARYDFTDIFGIQFDLSRTINNGYTTKLIFPDESSIYYYRYFSTTDICLMGTYTPIKNNIIYLTLGLGPNFSISDDTMKEGLDEAVDTVAIQNKYLFGVQGGVEGGIFINEQVATNISVYGLYDFTPMYNPELCSSWFSQASGNRFGIDINMGVSFFF